MATASAVRSGSGCWLPAGSPRAYRTSLVPTSESVPFPQGLRLFLGAVPCALQIQPDLGIAHQRQAVDLLESEKDSGVSWQDQLEAAIAFDLTGHQRVLDERC